MWQNHTIPKPKNPIQKLELIVEANDEANKASELQDKTPNQPPRKRPQ